VSMTWRSVFAGPYAEAEVAEAMKPADRLMAVLSLDTKAAPARCYPPRHRDTFEPTFLDLNDVP
jgi:hypothetical protein